MNTNKLTQMKHRNTLTLILLLAAPTLAAQNNYSPCYTNNMNAGNAAYKQGKYSEARTYYVNAKQCAGGNPTEAQKQIAACDAKIKAQKEAAEAKRKAEAETAEARRKAEAEVRGEFDVNGIAFKMLYVHGGTFTMGCTSEQGGNCESDEKPIHSVTLSDFLFGETEVTQALWEAVMETTVREQRDKAAPTLSMRGEGESYPMYYVSWNEAVEFCNKLNEKLRSQLPSGYRFALPTEAQWEYAARGGNKSKHCKFAGSNTIGDVAWYEENSSSETHPVKGKQANEIGLYDMSGNVWEWCSDWRGSYENSLQTNPKGPSSGSHRVLRGGSWNYSAGNCQVAYRNDGTPDRRSSSIGFRLALVQQ